MNLPFNVHLISASDLPILPASAFEWVITAALQHEAS